VENFRDFGRVWGWEFAGFWGWSILKPHPFWAKLKMFHVEHFPHWAAFPKLFHVEH
jgi:hypothetical protein